MIKMLVFLTAKTALTSFFNTHTGNVHDKNITSFLSLYRELFTNND